MSKLFIIKNQLGHYFGRNKAWFDGSEPRLLYRTIHKDEALNNLVELSAQDCELRATVESCDTNKENQPIVEVSEIPVPETEQERIVNSEQTNDTGA